MIPAGTPAAFRRATASRRRSAVDVRGSSAAQRLVERRHGQRDVGALIRGEVGEDVDVTGDERVLGDDADRIAELGQHVEASPGQSQRPLDRLVTVGDPAHRQHLRLPRRRRQGRPQQLGRVLLHEDAGLEIEAGG